MNTNETRRRKFIDFRSRSAIKMQRDAKTFLLGFATVAENRRIVTADFSAAGAFRSRTIEVFEDESSDRVHAVVDSCRHYEDEECIFFWRIQT